MRRRHSGPTVDMFPFLSVLCAVIGVLVLILLGAVSTRVAEADLNPISEPPFPVFEKQQTELGISDDLYEQLERQIQDLTAKLMERTETLQRLRQSEAELEDLIAAKEDESLWHQVGAGKLPGAAFEKPDDVEFVPVKTTNSKQPIFVEVKLDEFVIHPQGEVFKLSDLDSKSSRLGKYLGKVKHKKEYLLLLIHPNGVASYNRMRTYLNEKFPTTRSNRQRAGNANKSRFDVGFEPFTESWLLVSEQLKQ